MKNKGLTAAIVVLIGAIAAVIIVLICTGNVGAWIVGDDNNKKSTESTEQPADNGAPATAYFFFAEKKEGPYNIGHNAYAKALQETGSSDKSAVINYIMDDSFDKSLQNDATKDPLPQEFVDHKDSGKLAYRLYYDPALLAALANACDQQGFSGNNLILKTEADAGVAWVNRPDEALKRFLANPDDRKATYERVCELFFGSDTKVDLKEMSDYTSSVYMTDKDGNKVPEIVVLDTQNTGGHFVLFTLVVNGETKTLRLRLDCGYQPVDFPVPPTPKPPNPPDPPKKTPKDPKNDPQNREGADKKPFYSEDRKNNDQSTEVTSEPESPEGDRENPDPPEDEVEEVTEVPKEDKPDASKGTDSGSKTVDQTNGTTEKRGGKDYTVEAGNGKENGNLTDIADSSNKDKPAKEKPLTNDSVNSEAITDFE